MKKRQAQQLTTAFLLLGFAEEAHFVEADIVVASRILGGHIELKVAYLNGFGKEEG